MLKQLELFRRLVRLTEPPTKKRFRLPVCYEHKGQSIPFKLTRSRRRKYMAIYVLQDGEVKVGVPSWCPNDQIDQFIRERLDWILETLNESLPPGPGSTPGIGSITRLNYLDGEMHQHLGEFYPLRLVRSSRNGVGIESGQLVVRTRQKENKNHVRKLLDAWYRKESLSRFPVLLDQCVESVEYSFSVSALTVRKMKSRWGSCSKDGVICLNTRLIQKPVDLIEYVMMHELCHLTHFNHSRDFYELMDQLMPDWRVKEKLLVDSY